MQHAAERASCAGSNVRALNSKLFRDLWHARGQAVAIAAVMACGVAIMIMTYGAMTSLENTRDSYYERYRFADVFSQLKRAPLRVAAQISEIPGVAAVETRITRYAPVDIAGLQRPAAALLVSLPEMGEPRLNRIALRAGRLPAAGKDELVLSENMASAARLHVGSRLGVVMGGRKRVFTVVGIALSPEFVYVVAPGQLMQDDRAFGIMWMNRGLLEAAYDLHGAFNDVSVLLAPMASEADVIRRLDATLARYGGTAAYGRADQTSHAFTRQELDQLRTIAFLIPPIFLGVAAFLIHMVMTRLIDTERESIGLLKSFGYTNWEVGAHYLKFTMVIAASGLGLGCIGGIVLGQWMTRMYQAYFRFPFLEYALDPSVFSAALMISASAACAGTWAAVVRAARLAPAMAMQPPAPPVYRRSMIERWGLGRHISMPTQMMLRHIERWPLRAAMTGLGVAMAAMLLIGLFFFFDAIDELADSFYFRLNHQDVVIGLVDQKNPRAQFEAAHLPGVRRAEPVLEVAARIDNGHLRQRLGITGVDSTTPLRTFFDEAGRVFTVPAHGIVLSNKLASLLDLHIGDSAHVEILEGARHDTFEPVVAISSEHVGLAAYMDRRTLGDLVGTGAGITAIHALVDSAMTTALFRRLKEIPAVATVSTRAQAISALRETMARSMVIVIDFYIALGAIIAFGVLYSAARIALSERGRELASLRVLGFTQGEVTYILLGELALLVFAALPPGCLLGYGLAWLMSSSMETKLFRVPFTIAPATFGIAISIVLASAALSALAVAWRIRRLDLIGVLKTRE